MSKKDIKNIIYVVNRLEDLDSLDSFWYSFTLDTLLDNLRRKYLEYEDEEFYDGSEKLNNLKPKVVEWIAENDGIAIINGEFFNLVKEFDYWMFGKINANSLEEAKKIILLINKLYKIHDELND